MAVGNAYVFSWLSHTSTYPTFLSKATNYFSHMLYLFLKPRTTFLTCFCRVERRKYTGKKSCLNRGPNSQPQGHESDTLTTEPSRRVLTMSTFSFSHSVFKRPQLQTCKNKGLLGRFHQKQNIRLNSLLHRYSF